MQSEKESKGFNINHFADLSKKLDLEGINWQLARMEGLTATEVEILRYVADTEEHTMVYLKDLLTSRAMKNSKMTTFLAIWAYEELYHARALNQFLDACGHGVSQSHYASVTAKTHWRDAVENVIARGLAAITPRFSAVHMAWGALNELTTAAAYRQLAKRTNNSQLRTLLMRIVKQENKHFSFYFHEASSLLEGERKTQKLCRFVLDKFWSPVGICVGQRKTLQLLSTALFSGEDGWPVVLGFDSKMQELPGFSQFNKPSTWLRQLNREYLQRPDALPAEQFFRERPQKAA